MVIKYLLAGRDLTPDLSLEAEIISNWHLLSTYHVPDCSVGSFTFLQLPYEPRYYDILIFLIRKLRPKKMKLGRGKAHCLRFCEVHPRGASVIIWLTHEWVSFRSQLAIRIRITCAKFTVLCNWSRNQKELPVWFTVKDWNKVVWSLPNKSNWSV